MKPIYTLKREDNKFVVDEFLRGNSNIISLDDYVSQGNDASELFKNYLTENPSYGDNLRFKDSKPGLCQITDGNIVLDEISTKDIKIKVQGNEKFMDSVDYSQIFMNTKEYEDSKKKVSSDSGIMDNINGAIGELKRGGVRSALNKYKGLAMIVAGTALCGALTYGLSGGCSSDNVGYENKCYTDGTIDMKIKGLRSALTDFKDKYKNDKELAMLNIDEILWFDSQIEKDKLSEENRIKLEKLVEMAEKIKEEKK